MASWPDIAFQMSPELAADVGSAWSWLVPDPWSPVLCSKVGGVFLEVSSGEVLWLDTATGTVEQATATVDEFHESCRTNAEAVDNWFLPSLVDRLHEAGKVAGPTDCYGFVVLPVFAEGKYVPDNMFAAPVREVLIGNADIHKQIAELPDGSKVQVKIIG